MALRSLHLRLLLAAALTGLLALAIAWAGLATLFGRHIERQVVQELERDGKQLIGTLRLTSAGVPVADATPPDTRYQTPAGGFYWALVTNAGTSPSRSLWDQNLPASDIAVGEGWRTRHAPGPFGHEVLLVERRVRLSCDQRDVLVQVARDEAPIAAARRAFEQELAASLLLLWIVLAGASWVQVRLGLRPLASLRADVARIRLNPAARLGGRYPEEIEGLVAAINAMAEAREKDLGFARRRAADLAHSLKTPLAAIAAQSRRARKAGAEEAADGLDKALASASAALETELARARAAAHRAVADTRLIDTPVAPVIERIFTVVSRTEDGMRRVLDSDIADDLTLPVDPETLAELFGALIENAVRYARRSVIVRGGRDTARTWIAIEDDGAGMTDDAARHAVQRGARLDEAGPGHGLGLAIARDLAEASSGSLEFTRSALGGLRVNLSWDAATPARASDRAPRT